MIDFQLKGKENGPNFVVARYATIRASQTALDADLELELENTALHIEEKRSKVCQICNIYHLFFLYPVSHFLFSMSVEWLLSVARIDWTNWFWPTSKRLRVSKRGHGRSFGRIYPKSRHVLRNQRRSISNPYRQVNQLMPYQAERSAWSLSTSLVWNGNHDILYFILKKMIVNW